MLRLCKSPILPRDRPRTAIPMNTLLGPTTRMPIPTSLTTTARSMHTNMIMGMHMISILESTPVTHALAAR